MRTSDSRHTVINLHTNNHGAWLVALMVWKDSTEVLNHPNAEVIVTLSSQQVGISDPFLPYRSMMWKGTY